MQLSQTLFEETRVRGREPGRRLQVLQHVCHGYMEAWSYQRAQFGGLCKCATANTWVSTNDTTASAEARGADRDPFGGDIGVRLTSLGGLML